MTVSGHDPIPWCPGAYCTCAVITCKANWAEGEDCRFYWKYDSHTHDWEYFTVTIQDKQELGNLELEKVDTDNENIKLPNVGFKIQVSPGNYLALYRSNGAKVAQVVGTATINKDNKATGSQYRVDYNATEENATIFVTNSSGIIKVNNLEVYSAKDSKYTYKFVEVSNENYGFYNINNTGFISDSTGNIKLVTGKTEGETVKNKQVYTKITGYVWLENPSGKANGYDYVYTANTDSILTKEVKIQLRNKSTGEIIRQNPDSVDSSGKYTFADIKIEELSKYEVVFKYNGFYYSTVTNSGTLTAPENTASKVAEIPSERASLNNKFTEIGINGQIGTTQNAVEYSKDGHVSTVAGFNIDTNLSATTKEVSLDLKTRYDNIKKAATEVVEELYYINMGLVLREQPKLAIGSDINSVDVEVNGFNYTYYYNGRQNHYENLNGDEVGVKFEQENALQRYTRTVYSSDVEALAEGNATMNVSVTYKIKLINQSRTLTSIVNEVTNYFDSDYTVEAIGATLEEISSSKGSYYSNDIANANVTGAEQGKSYKSVKIPLGIQLKAGENKDIYIKFSVSQNAIKELLSGKSTYHNATEITGYTTKYGSGTGYQDGKKFTTDSSAVGSLYAGIDKSSEAGNIQLILTQYEDSNGKPDGTKILNTSKFEDDETSAPSFVLELTDPRTVSGSIWEDKFTKTEDKQKLGNGIYEDGENPVRDVIVELHKIKDDGSIDENIAIFSDGSEALTKTDANGKYTLGKNEGNVGIIPGRYVIKYTYNGETYIVNKESVDPNNYKSTIISSEVVKNAFENNTANQKWYLIVEDNRYSDARDDINLRPEYKYDKEDTTTNSTYENYYKLTEMNAYTPIMSVGIEFTNEDESNAIEWKGSQLKHTDFEENYPNIDFGIVEKPFADITIGKEITGLGVISQTGASIIPVGDPTDTNSRMQYVKYLPGMEYNNYTSTVSAEVESKLLQGATLSLEYTITIVNNSDRDYLNPDYYYYGPGVNNQNAINEITSTAKTVVDYLDNTMSLDEKKNQDGIWTKIEDGMKLYEQGYITEEVKTELMTNNYNIYTTEEFEDVGTGETGETKLYVSRALSVTNDDIREENKAEIIELTGKRIIQVRDENGVIQESIPGNYVPSEAPIEQDDAKVVLVITPPTGLAINYELYIIAGIATFAILIVGIVIIKKKIIK